MAVSPDGLSQTSPLFGYAVGTASKWLTEADSLDLPPPSVVNLYSWGHAKPGRLGPDGKT